MTAYALVYVSWQDVMDELERYFESNHEALARRLHAGVDAEALRHAYALVVNP